jgi:hypothetical protein
VGNLVCGNITGGSLACSGASSFASLSCNNLTVSNAETDAGTLTVTGLLTANGGISATNATLNGTSTIPSGGVLNVNTAAINLNTNGYLRFYNGAALQGNLDFGGNLVSSGAVNVTGTVTSGTGVVTPTVTASSTGTSITASGDVKYNGTTSLTSQMATLNGYKTSGSIGATTSFQTIFIPSNSRGIITAITTGGGSNAGMVMAFFEFTNGNTNPSLTQLAVSGNAFPQAVLNTPNTFSGTQTVFIQMVQSSPYPIQVKVATACTVYWYVTFL